MKAKFLVNLHCVDIFTFLWLYATDWCIIYHITVFSRHTADVSQLQSHQVPDQDKAATEDERTFFFPKV